MTTTDVSDDAIARSVNNEPEATAAPMEKPLNRATKAAYARAKKASHAQDAASTEQVEECRRKREGIVSARAPAAPGKQSNLFDF